MRHWDGDQHVTRVPETLWRHTLTGVLLLAPGVEEPVLVTTPGDVVWDALAEPVTIDMLTRSLSEGFGAPLDRVRADVCALLDQLESLGAVQVSAPSSEP